MRMLAVVLGFWAVSLAVADEGGLCWAATSAVCCAASLIRFRGGVLVTGLPMQAWVFSEFVVWNLSYVLLRYVFDFEVGSHPETRFYLLSLYFSGACVAAVCWHKTIRKIGARLAESLDAMRSVPYLRQIDTALLGVTGVYLAAYFASGGLTARDEIGNNVGSGQMFYWVRGFESVPYVFLFVRGVLWSSTHNPRLFLTPAVICLLSLLTGGRGIAFYYLAIMLTGCASNMRRVERGPALVFGAAVLVAGAAFQFFGKVRDSEQFRSATSIMERLEAVGSAEAQTTGNGRRQFGLSEETLLRINEPFGQAVIDDVKEEQVFAGWSHFERLAYVYAPAFLIPDKRPLDDGPEVLRDEYGFDVDDFKSLPITFLADAYRRWGQVGAFVCGFAIISSMVLVLYGLSRIRDPLLAGCALAQFIIVVCLRLYPYSVLGGVGLVLYTFGRNVVVAASLLFIARKAVFAKKAGAAGAGHVLGRREVGVSDAG